MNSTRSAVFILAVALAAWLPAGCADDPENSLCEANGVSVTIADNHPSGAHVLVIPVSDVLAAVPVVYDILGNEGHVHTLSVSTANFTDLQTGTVVSLVTSALVVGDFHDHAITLSCNP